MKVAVTISWEEIQEAVVEWADEHGLHEVLQIGGIEWEWYQEPGGTRRELRAKLKADAGHLTQGPYR